MKNAIKAWALAILAYVSIAAPCFAQGADIPDDVKQSIRTRVDAGKNVGIVVGIIDSSGPRYYGYGKVSQSSGRVPDEHSVFEIGSITKVFTSILLADMVLRNELGLDDPIERYLPDEVKVPTRKDQLITLAHLATHTSGLPPMPDDFTLANNVDYPVEQMYEFLSHHTLRRDIGAEYEYSTYGVGLLAHILTLRSAMSYEELVRRRIGDVIGLEDTRITLTPAMQRRLAKGHFLGFEMPNWDAPPTLAGAGGLRSTARDMLRFLAANMGLMETPLYQAMQLTHQPRIEAGGAGMQGGLGWRMRVSGGRETIWHTGSTGGGYISFAGFLRGGEMGVVVLTNSIESAGDIGFHLLDPSFPLRPLDPSLPLREVKPSIAVTLRATITERGLEAAIQQHRDLKTNQSDAYDFGEPELNRLGYLYLRGGDLETALGIFKLNAETYPEAWNTYDSLGEAYMEQGNTDLAIANYRRSLQLNPGNDNAREMLARMGA